MHSIDRGVIFILLNCSNSIGGRAIKISKIKRNVPRRLCSQKYSSWEMFSNITILSPPLEEIYLRTYLRFLPPPVLGAFHQMNPIRLPNRWPILPYRDFQIKSIFPPRLMSEKSGRNASGRLMSSKMTNRWCARCILQNQKADTIFFLHCTPTFSSVGQQKPLLKMTSTDVSPMARLTVPCRGTRAQARARTVPLFQFHGWPAVDSSWCTPNECWDCPWCGRDEQRAVQPGHARAAH